GSTPQDVGMGRCHAPRLRLSPALKLLALLRWEKRLDSCGEPMTHVAGGVMGQWSLGWSCKSPIQAFAIIAFQRAFGGGWPLQGRWPSKAGPDPHSPDRALVWQAGGARRH